MHSPSELNHTVDAKANQLDELVEVLKSAQPDDRNSHPSNGDRTNDDQSVQTQKSPIEWLSFGISLTIIGALVGAVGFLWLKPNSQKPPNPIVSVHLDKTEMRDGQFHVPFEVTNAGDQTITQLQMIGELKRKGTVEEIGTQQIDFLSRREVEEGVFVLPQKPQKEEFSVRITSYQIP
ncbi:TIGR02588 family protein [Alkalinema sp. FACHB-956]|uniref:TIGR02588 family protein n=1 Tax=Alkalinema sp. FACHB-956 TaxID=2692768 RepID=UPI00168A3CE3|nr:TIGR02588 family protein [Alkalinema sp. FACHB-956]MBD2328013.1 TIGR02588 family protein [Alkalinema sp. FACHB-956]